VLAEGQALGAVRDDLPVGLLAQALFGALSGIDRWFLERWDTLPPSEAEQLSVAALRLARDLVEPRQQRGGAR
jgi:hypothetical protein